MSCKHVCHECVPSKNGGCQKRKREKKNHVFDGYPSIFVRGDTHRNRSFQCTHNYITACANNNDNNYPVSIHYIRFRREKLP